MQMARPELDRHSKRGRDLWPRKKLVFICINCAGEVQWRAAGGNLRHRCVEMAEGAVKG